MFPGLNIKKLGFGLMRLPMLDGAIDIEQVKQMVDLFMAKGFSYFDSAWGYHDGLSEVVAKTAIVDRYPRESFQLATKLPAWMGAKSEKEAKDMFWTSLERSGAGYFDFFLLHNLGLGRTECFDKFGIWDFLAEQKKEGRIRRLGFSIHATAEYLEKMLTEHPDMEFVQLQINYADWENSIIQSRRCYEVARKFGKPVVIMEPIKGGSLSKLTKEAGAILDQANPAASRASWALRFAASLDGVLTVLSGMSTLEQMKENLSVMDPFVPLTSAERGTLDEVCASLAKTPQIPCTDCKYCMKDCPKNISIPEVFKLMNDYNIYRRIGMAKGGYVFATRSNGKASECIACGNCEKACPQSIQIIEELKKAAAVLEG